MTALTPTPSDAQRPILGQWSFALALAPWVTYLAIFLLRPG
jgi:hypothetical protein